MSFQCVFFRDHSDAIYSPNSTINSDKISGIVTDPEYQELTRRGSLQHHHCHPRDRLSHTAQSLTDDSVSLLHETHFGDSLTDIPRTVIRAIPHCEKISPDDLERIAKSISRHEQEEVVDIDADQSVDFVVRALPNRGVKPMFV